MFSIKESSDYLVPSHQGLLTLDNGTTIDGTFSGSWTKKIEIVKGTLEEKGQRSSEGGDDPDSAIAELQ